MKNIVVAGDSHARRFSSSINVIGMEQQQYKLHVRGISAASARGFATGSKTTNSQDKIRRLIKSVGQPPDAICFAFGQVDVEAGYYFRKFVRGDDIDFMPFAEKIVVDYMQLAAGYLEQAHMIIKGVNFPVLIHRAQSIRYVENEINIRKIANKFERRKSRRKFQAEYPSLAERSEHVLIFNGLLADGCKQYGFRYFDINEQLVDPETGLVHDRYIPIDSSDNHVVASAEVAKIYRTSLACSFET